MMFDSYINVFDVYLQPVNLIVVGELATLAVLFPKVWGWINIICVEFRHFSSIEDIIN